MHKLSEKQKSNSNHSASGWVGAKPSPESSASIGRDYLELSKGERTGNCDCADNEAMQSRRIPYDFNEDHNPVPVGTCERIRNNNAPTGWRTPAAG